MVKINNPQMTTQNGIPWPVMHQDNLRVVKDAPTFKEGDTITCFIARYDRGRYAVFTASFISVPNYHVFNSEQELHEHFEEV